MLGTLLHEEFYTRAFHSDSGLGVYVGVASLASSGVGGRILFNETRTISLISSGECFLDPDLRRDLTSRGHSIGENPAEWFVHLYEEFGLKAFEKLNGPFSGVLVDLDRRKAFLFTDRCGVERIYLYQTDTATYFASESKAILRSASECRQFDSDGVAQFLAFGCTLDWSTLFRGVKVLPAGSVLTYDGNKSESYSYFNPGTLETQTALTEEAFETEFESSFRRVLSRYLDSTEIGISLTAGLDTRMIMACRPEVIRPPRCYTFAGERGETLDAVIAGKVARECGLEHSLLRIGPDFFSDFATHADRTVYKTDGCFGFTGAHEIYLNRQARALAPIRVTGNFGSEILRGVSTFKPIGLSRSLIEPSLISAVNAAIGESNNEGGNPVSLAAFKEIPWSLFGSLAAGRSQVTFRTPYLDNELVSLAFRAPEHLRRSPQTALRVVRENNPALFRIPTDRGLGGERSGLACMLDRIGSEVTFKLDYLYNEGLPHWLSPLDPLLGKFNSGTGFLGRHKYLHYRRWFRSELADCIKQQLNDSTTLQLPFFNPAFVRELAAAHIGGRMNYVTEINAVLTLAAVKRLLLKP